MVVSQVVPVAKTMSPGCCFSQLVNEAGRQRPFLQLGRNYPYLPLGSTFKKVAGADEVLTLVRMTRGIVEPLKNFLFPTYCF